MSNKKLTPELPEAWLAIGDGLRIRVWILGVKSPYGRPRCLVTPVAGDGERWVWQERLEMIPASQLVPAGATTGEAAS